MLLILTVGTGTAGRNSSLADGLVASIRLAKVDQFLLVPSASPESREVADLVRACAPENTHEFAFPDETPPELARHDDLEQCRMDLLLLFHRLLQWGHAELALNPTSGTKQMSAAAILAALEAGVSKIHYTVGERANGVVKTGTEKLQPFATQTVHAARARADARRLLIAGAFSGARELLLPWSASSDSQFLINAAAMMSAWARFAYQEAASTARSLEHPKAPTWAKGFDQLHASGPTSPVFLGDLLDHAAFLAAREDYTSALATLYRATEQAAKTVLAQNYRLLPPYPLGEVLPLAPQHRHQSFRVKARDGSLHLGLRETMELLRDLDEPLGLFYFDQAPFRHLLDQRNQTVFGHGHRPVSPSSVSKLRQFLTQALQESSLKQTLSLQRSKLLHTIIAP